MYMYLYMNRDVYIYICKCLYIYIYICIGFVIGLMDFFADAFPGRSKRDYLLYSLVLLPPTIIAIADPNIFRGALEYAGTYLYDIYIGYIIIYIHSSKV
jgi:hypothetical protein